jgi:hypothetical protein
LVVAAETKTPSAHIAGHSANKKGMRHAPVPVRTQTFLPRRDLPFPVGKRQNIKFMQKHLVVQEPNARKLFIIRITRLF